MRKSTGSGNRVGTAVSSQWQAAGSSPPSPTHPACLPLTELPLGLAHGPRTPGPLEEMVALQQTKHSGPGTRHSPELSGSFGLSFPSKYLVE